MASSIEIPEKMYAAQVVEFNKPYRISQIPTPKPSDLREYELLVKVAVGSYCHTDSMVSSGVFDTKLPCTGSHEGAGVVVAAGSAQTASWKPGDRVMAGIAKYRCGECDDCKGPEEYHHYCPNVEGLCGVTTDGSFAEYVVIDGRQCARVPEGVGFEMAAPLACAGCTIYKGLLQTKAKKGEWIAIVGSGGGLGHIGIKMGKAMGLNIIGIDARDEALDLTRESGADVALDARVSKDELVKQVAEHSGTAHKGKHAGVEAAIVLSEHDSAAGLACAITRMHGTMVQVAQPTNVSIPFFELVFRDIRIKGSMLCSRTEAEDMLKLVDEHNIKVQVNLFHGLKEMNKMLDLVHGGKMKGKAMIVMDEQLVSNGN